MVYPDLASRKFQLAVLGRRRELLLLEREGSEERQDLRNETSSIWSWEKCRVLATVYFV